MKAACLSQIKRTRGYWLQFALGAFVVSWIGGANAQGVVRAEAPTIKVGDRWKTEQSDKRTGVKESEFDRRITAVTASQIEGTENDAKLVLTPELNVLESSIGVVSGEPKALSFPLEIGKKWSYKTSTINKITGVKARQEYDVSVIAYEKIKVPSGEFDTFRIESKGFWNNDTNNRNGTIRQTLWYAPATRSVVRSEYADGYNNWVRQLVEFQLQP